MKRYLQLLGIAALVVPAMIAMTVVAEPYNMLLQTNCDGGYHVVFIEQCP